MWCEKFALEAPSTLVLPIELARERDIMADRDDTKTTVKIVGIKPERWKVEGRSNIPGPVILFTTRARLLNGWRGGRRGGERVKMGAQLCAQPVRSTSHPNLPSQVSYSNS